MIVTSWATTWLGLAARSLPLALTGLALLVWTLLPWWWRGVPAVLLVTVAALYGGLVGSWPAEPVAPGLRQSCAYLVAQTPDYYERAAQYRAQVDREPARLERCAGVLVDEAERVRSGRGLAVLDG